MMHFTCEHGNICRECPHCYDDARARSELHEFGVFIPEITRCSKHPDAFLTEDYNCILCMYADTKKEENRDGFR